VEDASSRGPVAVEVASLEESVSFLEQKVVVNKLLLNLLVHSLERVEISFEVLIELASGSNNVVHDLKTLLFGDSWAERVSIQVSSDSDSG